MAIWNSQVRGQVMAIKRWMGWDPTEIVDRTNPMPSHPDNRNGMGTMLESEALPSEKSMPAMDRLQRPTRKGGSDPYPGMGNQ